MCSMLYIIHGQDTFRSHLALRALTAQHQAVDTHDADQVKPEDIRDFIQSESLFATSKTCVLKNAFSERPVVDVVVQHTTLIAPHKHTTLILYESKDASANVAFKKLKEHSAVETYNKPTQAQNISFLRDYFKKHLGITDAIVAQVYNKCGENMHLTFSELQKLSTLRVDRVATQQDIQDLCIGTTEENVFATIDTIFSRNKTRAFEKLQSSWASGESPEMMFAMLERHMRVIVLVRSELDKKTPHQEIAQKTNLHPFVVKKTTPVATQLSWNAIQKLYNRIQSLDSKVKQGYISPYFACELFSFAVLSM